MVGQPNFVDQHGAGQQHSHAVSLLGPQGVWIQNGKLYVADTQNNRVLIYNKIPTANGVAADVVLGQPNFNTYVQIDISQQTHGRQLQNMLNPVAVTSDWERLDVADLANNRILIWNSVPTANDAPADLALGQPNLNTSIPNYAYSVDTTNTACSQIPIGPACVETPILCPVSKGEDVNSNPTYPNICNATLNFPRFALFAGNRLFVADSGNDRVLVFDTIPTQNGASADVIIGQIGTALGDEVTQAYNAVDSLQTPMSLAWDGTNLFVSDPFDRRITVYSMGANSIPYSGVRNGASFEVSARGAINLAGAINAGDVATITISEVTNGVTTTNTYTYTVLATDTLSTVCDGVAAAINSSNNGAGDPYVVALSDHVNSAVRLFAKTPGSDGDNVDYTAAVSVDAKLAVQAAGGNLTNAADASQVSAGTLVSIFPNTGSVLAYGTAEADLTQTQLPTELAGTEVYLDGIPAPLLYVSPTQINTQIPWELANETSINCYVRTVASDGTVVATTPVAITIVPANPGIFSYFNTTGPQRVAVMLHGSSYANGVISVDGGIIAGDIGYIRIHGREYSYIVQSTDTLASVRDAMAAMINAADPEVTATPTAEYTRMILQARIQGPAGEGTPYSAEVKPAPVTNGGELVLTPFTSNLCCSSLQYSLVTPDNPATVGEIVLIYATGVGLPIPSDTAGAAFVTGQMFAAGTPPTQPEQEMGAATAGISAQVLQVAAKAGTFGVFEIMLELERIQHRPVHPVDYHAERVDKQRDHLSANQSRTDSGAMNGLGATAAPAHRYAPRAPRWRREPCAPTARRARFSAGLPWRRCSRIQGRVPDGERRPG